MINKNKTMFSLGIITFLNYLSFGAILIFISSGEKLTVLLPWIFLLPILLSIIAIVKSLSSKMDDKDEKIENLGPLGPKPQIFYSASNSAMFSAVVILISSIIGFLFFMNLVYFSSF